MKNSSLITPEISNRILSAQRIWLFLDYDGTLADFAPNPDIIIQDRELIQLLKQLSSYSKMRLSIISGRRLNHILKLIPIDNIDHAGSYGIEIRLRNGKSINRMDLSILRPIIDRIKPLWSGLIEDQNGYYLEDKGWTLAIHARRAAPGNIEKTLSNARSIASTIAPDKYFKILGGYKFIEIAPLKADKANSTKYLLDQFSVPNQLPIFMGDDDKDEAAFSVIYSAGGLPILISKKPRQSKALIRLNSPADTRRWLIELMNLIA